MKFDAELCAKYVESLVLHDEVERALLVLDNVPAEYRDHTPPVLAKLKAEILSRMYTPHTYVHCMSDARIQVEHSAQVLEYLSRGKMLILEIEQMNKEGKTPHIVDMGPGTYFVPLGLSQKGFRFTYEDVSLNVAAAKAAGVVKRPRLSEEQPTIFLAMEIIEHLPAPRDLVTECLRHCKGYPDRVFLSTPRYTFDVNSHDAWRTNEEALPHLRAYTPTEFYTEAVGLFPGYHWELDLNQVMTLRGAKKSGGNDGA